MNPIDQTPLAEVDGLTLANELRDRMAEPQTLGIRIRIALIAAELDRRARGEAA